LVFVGALLLLALAGLVFVLAGQLGGDPEPRQAGEGRGQRAADADPAADPSRDDDAEDPAADDPVTEPAQDAPDDGPVALLEGWTTFEVADTGATIGYPGDWQVVERSATATDLQDPDSGSYLRIDYTDEPRDDPVADWQAQSDSFAASHDNYTEVSIEQEDYRDYNAALWEYTYTEGDRQLHAYNLGLVAGDYGYALNFQTREENWEASQDLFESFKDTFSPPT